MMRKIQRKRKSSTEKASEDSSADEKRDSEDSAAEEEGDGEGLWRHFVRLDESSAQCGHCEKRVGCGTTLAFLRGHLTRRHPQQQKKDSSFKTAKSTPDQDRDVNSDDQVGKDNPAAEEQLGKGRRLRAGVWQFFVRLNKTSAQCRACKRDLNYSASISNLKRHLKLKHPHQHTQLMSPKVSFGWQKTERKRKRTGKLTAADIKEYVDENETLDSEYQPETDDSDHHLQMDLKKNHPKRQKSSDAWVWSSFEKVDQETARCTLCEEIIDYRATLSRLRRHLEQQHTEEVGGASERADEMETNHPPGKDDSDDLLRRRKSDLWNHFVPLSKEIARCKHCSKSLNYRSSATNLRRHLKVMHPWAFDQLATTTKSTDKKSGASSRKQATPFKTSTPTAIRKKREKSPAKKKNAFTKRKVNASDEDASDGSEVPTPMDDGSDEYSADESEVQTTFREDENSPEKRPVRSSKDAFSRIVNQNETSPSSKGGSSALNENRKQTTSVPRPKKVHAKRKRSRLWDFFTVLDEKFAECNACRHRLVHKSGLSNLAKHYSMKHSAPPPAAQQHTTGVTPLGAPPTGLSEVEMAVNALNHSDGQASESQPIEVPEEEGSPTKKQKKGGRRRGGGDGQWRCAISRLFERLDETFSQCRSCLKRISHRSTNANLLKHTRIKHPDIYCKFEERIKDFSHNVNILVEHFFPESLITAPQSGDSVPQTVPSHEADPMPHQEYHMTENPPPHMYDSYSFPVIFVQEEEVAGHAPSEQPIATTSVITSAPPNPIQAAPTNLSGLSSYTIGGGGHTSQDAALNLGSAHMPNHTQDSAPLNNPRANHHPPAYMSGGASHNVGGVVNNAGVVSSHNAVVSGHNVVGGTHNVGVVSNHNVGGVNVGGSFPSSFSGNYQQVLTTSFNVNGGGVAQSSDRLIGMVEESNQLLRGMQSAIERQSDVLIRLAESIATGMRAS